MGNAEKGDTVKNFLKTLADNNRLGILEGICEKFAVLMGAAKGEMELVVQSASVSRHLLRNSRAQGESIQLVSGIADALSVQKLDQKTIQRLETAVAKSEYSQGKKLKVVTKVWRPIECLLSPELRSVDSMHRSIRISWVAWSSRLEIGPLISVSRRRSPK